MPGNRSDPAPSRPRACLAIARPAGDAADDFEGRLLDIGDRSYALTVDALLEQFAQQAGFSALAISAMEGLDAISRVLVQRGLLPLSRPSDGSSRTQCSSSPP